MEEILAYVELIPEFKPVVKGVIENLKAYEDEYVQISDFVINQSVRTRTKMYKGFIENGISPEHALALTVSVVKEFETAIKSGINTKKGK